VQFPIARAYAQMRAAELMVHEAARKYEAGEDIGPEANMAKLLAADASWFAADMCVQTFGGFGFAEEYDVERKFRETRCTSGTDLYQHDPVLSRRTRARPAALVLIWRSRSKVFLSFPSNKPWRRRSAPVGSPMPARA